MTTGNHEYDKSDRRTNWIALALLVIAESVLAYVIYQTITGGLTW